jgi:hypothetical protein
MDTGEGMRMVANYGEVLFDGEPCYQKPAPPVA